MGKWNYRRTWRPKNYYRDQRIPSPPTYYETEFKLRGAWKNVELPWEERYCISVGIPWEKVVNAKRYMHCYDNVVKWNDSVSEESFRDAKKQFWEKINGIPTDDTHLDPDMYNHEIDWNPSIDPELIRDLDLAYFNPDEAEKSERYYATKINNDGFASGCILGLDGKNISNCDDPWERNKNDNNMNNNSSGWNCLNDNGNKNVADPWERETKDNSKIEWGGGGSSLWHKESNNETTWEGGAKNSWHWSQYSNQRVVDDNSRNTWGTNGNSGGYVSSSRGGYNRQRGSQWHGQRDGQRQNGSGWESNVGCRKREGSQQYTSSYKSARVQSDDYGESNRYRR